MQTDIAGKIRDLGSRPHPLSESEVSHLMTLCRKYIDYVPEEKRSDSLILRFFCNWAAHINLDRSMEGIEILKKINDALVDCASESQLIFQRVTEILSFRQLRRELGSLLEECDTPDRLDNDQARWENYVQRLIEIVRDCPIQVGEASTMSRRARQVFESIVANPLRKDSYVIGVAIKEIDYRLHGGSDSDQICMVILLSETTRIVVPLAASEVFGELV